MRNEADRDSGVTYIGPRSFVVGFAVICGVLLAIGFGATRIAESIEALEPIAPTASAPVAATANVPIGVTTNAPIPPTTKTPIPQTADAPILGSAIVPPPSSARDSIARPRATSPAVDLRMMRAAAPVPRRVAGTASTASRFSDRPQQSRPRRSAIVVAPMTSTQHPTAARIARLITAAPRHVPGLTRNAAAQLATTPLPKGTAHPARAPIASRARQTLVQVVPPPAGILVPFKTAALISSGALKPRSAGGAPLVISPAPSPATASGTATLRVP